MLDAQKWAKRAFLVDIFTLGVLIVVGVALVRDAYTIGATIGTDQVPSAINRLMLDVALGIAGLAWLAYRVIRHSYKAIASPV